MKLPINLSPVEWKEVAGLIGCEIAAMKAVVMKESNGQAFLPDGRVLLRFEVHYWWRLLGQLKGVVLAKTPTRISFEIGDVAWSFCATKGRQHTNHLVRFGKSGVWQKFHGNAELEWKVFEAARQIDERIAIQCASYGAPQIMGANWRVTGHSSPESFFADMCESEYRQIRVMAAFINGQRLDDDLRRKDWVGFSFGYNGPSYYLNNYPQDLAKYYAYFKTT